MAVCFCLVTVPVYTNKPGGKRNYEKTDHCFYCSKIIQSKVTRHILRHHTDKELVKQAISSTGKQRESVLYKIRQLGNYMHNVQVKPPAFANTIVGKVVQLYISPETFRRVNIFVYLS